MPHPTVIWRESDFMQFLPAYPEYSEMNSLWKQRKFSPDVLASVPKELVIDNMLRQDYYKALTPRWKLVALSLQAKHHSTAQPLWLDAMLTDSKNNPLHIGFAQDASIPVFTRNVMDSVQMSHVGLSLSAGSGRWLRNFLGWNADKTAPRNAHKGLGSMIDGTQQALRSY